jgi:hypothetical protein
MWGILGAAEIFRNGWARGRPWLRFAGNGAVALSTPVVTVVPGQALFRTALVQFFAISCKPACHMQQLNGVFAPLTCNKENLRFLIVRKSGMAGGRFGLRF